MSSKYVISKGTIECGSLEDAVKLFISSLSHPCRFPLLFLLENYGTRFIYLQSQTILQPCFLIKNLVCTQHYVWLCWRDYNIDGGGNSGSPPGESWVPANITRYQPGWHIADGLFWLKSWKSCRYFSLSAQVVFLSLRIVYFSKKMCFGLHVCEYWTKLLLPEFRESCSNLGQRQCVLGNESRWDFGTLLSEIEKANSWEEARCLLTAYLCNQLRSVSKLTALF